MRGVAFPQFCFRQPRRWLDSEIAAISGLPREVVKSIGDALTYGSNTTVPDPALQPIIPVAGGAVAVPAISTISCNWQRNLLSLHARTSTRTFNNQSKVFERRMVEGLARTLNAAGLATRENITLPTREGPEEVDIVAIDPQSRSLLFCELRYMVQPGDIREVLERQRALREKVVQVERKCHRANSSLRDICALLGLEMPTEWRAVGLVIVEGFGGVLSPKPNEFPIVPKTVFVRGLAGVRDVRKLHSILSTPLWLPREGSDIELTEDDVTYFGSTFRRNGLRAGTEDYMARVEGYFREAALKTREELEAIPW